MGLILQLEWNIEIIAGTNAVYVEDIGLLLIPQGAQLGVL